MATVKNPDRYKDVPGWVPVIDDFGNFRCYHFVEDVRAHFMREATPEEKDALTIDLEWLERHVVEDDNGCWVWKGFITKGGQPQARFTLGPFVHCTMLVRRLVARMKFEPSAKFPDAAAFHRNRQAGTLEGCSWGCCHPDHVVMRTKKQAMKPSRGKPLTLEHRQAISRARRAQSKVPDSKIVEIIASPKPAKHVSIELGMDPSYASKVRRGNCRIYSATGGMFSGLLAANHGAFYDEEEAA